MKIIGFAINKISAEKKKRSNGKIEIKNNLSIDNISEEQVDIVNKSTLKFDFSYGINYEPNLAEIKILGSVLGTEEPEIVRAILKDWKDKKFTSELKLGVLNYIMSECLLRALNLEKELGLPSHIPLPKIKGETKNPVVSNSNPANYTG